MQIINFYPKKISCSKKTQLIVNIDVNVNISRERKYQKSLRPRLHCSSIIQNTFQTFASP